MNDINKIAIARNSIDPSTEIDDTKRVDVLIETMHENMFKKEEEQPQQSSFRSSEEVTNTLAVEQHTRRTVTFDDDYHQSFLSSTRDSISNGQQKERNSSPRLSNIPVGFNPTNSFAQDFDNLVSRIVIP